jgi:hypothetical protein
MDKKDILSNIEHLSSEHLTNYIQNGVVTLEELIETEMLESGKRKRIVENIKKKEAEENQLWEKIDKSSLAELKEFLEKYPNGKFSENAKKLKNQIEEEWNSRVAEKNDILSRIRENSNLFKRFQIINYLNKGIISIDDLTDCGIPEEVIEKLNTQQEMGLPERGTTDKITTPSGYTDVFFWGFPGSGKTTAIGAILKKADGDGLLEREPNGNGFHYMTRLINIFNDKIAILPRPSPIDLTWYLSFSLKRRDGNQRQKISFIDISGEIFELFYHVNAGNEFPTDEHKKTYNDLNRILSNANRKIHFFFIAYDKNIKLNEVGLRQVDYLAAAATYFQKHEIFKNKTDSIYVVLTKSDLLSIDSYPELVKQSEKYLNDNYPSFINTLRDRCRKYGINGGSLLFEPFSLGRVYFFDICKFNDESAKRMVDTLMTKKRCILDLFKK